jgi:MerR family copper efflux transcriptional regulator
VSWQTNIPESLLSIAQVRERTGLSARTLRYYEELGLLPGVRRRSGGRRVYGADEIERVGFIQRLKALGLSLADIKELNAVHAIEGGTGAMLVRLDELLDRHLDEIDGRLRELMGLRDEISKYRDHVASRRERLARSPEATRRRKR